MSKLTDFSPDDLLAQATCAVLIDDEIRGTAWLVKDQEYLLTAGHVLGKDKPYEKLKVQFLDDIPRTAINIHWIYQPETGDDFAILKLVDPPTDHHPLPVSLALENKMIGQFRVRGYGQTLLDQAGGVCTFVAPYYPKNSSKYCLFQLSSKELGEPGYSGAAIFSDELEAVVAIQTEATIADVGPSRDIILAIPLYRIAQIWRPLAEETPSPLPAIQLVLAGPSADFNLERRTLLLQTLVNILNITWDDIRILNIADGSCIVTLQLPEDKANQLLDPKATQTLRNIEEEFINKALKNGLEPHYFRIIRVRRAEPEPSAYDLDFANRKYELNKLLNPGSQRYTQVVAPAGFGKTYLLDQLEKEFTKKGWQVVRINFSQPDAPKTEAESLAIVGQQLGQRSIESIEKLGRYTGSLETVFLLDGTENAPDILKRWLVETVLSELENRVKKPRVIAASRHHIPEWPKHGRSKFNSLPLSPFHEDVIEDVLRQQVNKREKLQLELESAFFRGWAKVIFNLSKGHPLCISNVIRWLDDNQDFTMKPSLTPDRQANIFFEQICPVIDEQILGHLTERNTLELVRFFCVLRGYNANIIHWLAHVASQDEATPQELRKVLEVIANDLIKNSIRTLRNLNNTRLDGSLGPLKDIFRFDSMIRQLISLQVELEDPVFFWQIHQWTVTMYDYWIEGIDRPGEPLSLPPADQTQSRYMVEALYHHARLMHHQQITNEEAVRQLTQYVRLYCEQARSTAGWTGQTIQQFLDWVDEDEELNYYLRQIIGDKLIAVLAPAYKMV